MMHLEILVEDVSGKEMLDVLVPKLICGGVTHRILPYRGIGKLPKDLRKAPDPSTRILLANLPRILGGYGKAFAKYEAAVIVVCDLDDRDPDAFLSELEQVVSACDPAPQTFFCLAIEEGEAWLLGDLDAVRAAYPKAKAAALASYQNDSICGTWEKLADAIYPGGAKALAKQGWSTVGAQKSEWARRISPRLNLDSNRSPSFQSFRDRMRAITPA